MKERRNAQNNTNNFLFCQQCNAMKQQPTLSSLHTTHHTSITQTQHKTTVHAVFVLGYLGLFLRWAVPEISTKKKYHNSKIIF